MMSGSIGIVLYRQGKEEVGVIRVIKTIPERKSPLQDKEKPHKTVDPNANFIHKRYQRT